MKKPNFTIITLDIDSKEPIALLNAVRGLGEFYKQHLIFSRLEIRESRKKGYHIKFLAPERLSKKEVLFIRKICGDDPKRIAKDTKRKGAPTNILFSDYKRVVWLGKIIKEELYNARTLVG